MRRMLLAIAVSLVLAVPAFADPGKDAEQAGAAFDRGDFAKAVALYSAAAQDQGLSGSDRAIILVNRGVVYSKLGNRVAAIRDFRAAQMLSPGDPDAEMHLRQLHAPVIRHAKAAPSAPAPAISANRWGPMAYLAGRDWIGSIGKPVLYVRYQWSVPNAVLAYSGQDAAGQSLTGVVTFDALTGKLTEQQTYGRKLSVETIEVAGDRAVSVSGEGSKQVQQTMILLPEGYFQIVNQKRAGNDWKTTQVVVLTITTPAFVNGLGWPVAGQQDQHVSFLKELGRSLKGGALAGIHDGVQDGVHDAAQDRIRRLTDTQTPPTQTTRVVQ